MTNVTAALAVNFPLYAGFTIMDCCFPAFSPWMMLLLPDIGAWQGCNGSMRACNDRCSAAMDHCNTAMSHFFPVMTIAAQQWVIVCLNWIIATCYWSIAVWHALISTCNEVVSPGNESNQLKCYRCNWIMIVTIPQWIISFLQWPLQHNNGSLLTELISLQPVLMRWAKTMMK